MFHVQLRRMFILLVLDELFCMYLLSSSGLSCHLKLLDFFVWMIYLLIVNEILKSPMIIVLLCISPFSSVNIYFIYLGVPLLGAQIFTSYIMLFNWPPYQCVMSLTFITVFVLKPILSDISIATPAFFWFPFTWNIFFCPFMLSLCIVCFKQNNKVKPQGGRKLNKIEISNLPDKEFKVVVIKMLTGLQIRMMNKMKTSTKRWKMWENLKQKSWNWKIQ